MTILPSGQMVTIALQKGSWFSEDLRRRAVEESKAIQLAETAGFKNRANTHRSNILSLWREDRALKEYAEFPKKFAGLGLPTNPTPIPIEIQQCEHYGCQRIWLDDGVPIKIGGSELFRAPGWAHLREVNLDSEYPVPASGIPLYITVAALQQIVPRNQIMVLVEQEHEQPKRERKPDPLLVARAGKGYYLIARWK